MARPNFTKIVKQLETGEPFSLTAKQYQNKTGASIPKETYYLLNNSAIARKAKEYGYKLAVQERILLFEKEE